MRFGDVVTAVASLGVIVVSLEFLLGMTLVPALGCFWGPVIEGIIVFLLSTLIVGYIYAEKIWEEARLKTIAQITVLAAVLLIFAVMIEYAAFDWTAYVKETYLAENPSAVMSAAEWLMVEEMYLMSELFLNTIMVFVLGFIGFYIGSALRKPSKS